MTSNRRVAASVARGPDAATVLFRHDSPDVPTWFCAVPGRPWRGSWADDWPDVPAWLCAVPGHPWRGSWADDSPDVRSVGLWTVQAGTGDGCARPRGYVNELAHDSETFPFI
jgi:hypothetical protein